MGFTVEFTLFFKFVSHSETGQCKTLFVLVFVVVVLSLFVGDFKILFLVFSVVYGVTTGFGKFARVVIPLEKLK